MRDTHVTVRSTETGASLDGLDTAGSLDLAKKSASNLLNATTSSETVDDNGGWGGSDRGFT
jgi:hypothetical protein